MIKKYPLYYNLDTGGGADVSGVTATAGDVDEGKIFVDSSGAEVEGTSTYKSDYTSLHTLVGQTTAVAEDVAQGKVFVNSSGVQTTGTASGGSDDLLTMLNRPSNSKITIPTGVTTIPGSAFMDFTTLVTLIFSDTVTLIGNGAFYNCRNANFSNLPNSLVSIVDYAFYRCWGLTDITFPATLSSISYNSFNDCTGLTSVTFLGTPTTIASNAFNKCTNLTTIRVPWSSGAVAGAPWGAVNSSIIYGYTPTT